MKRKGGNCWHIVESSYRTVDKLDMLVSEQVFEEEREKKKKKNLFGLE